MGRRCDFIRNPWVRQHCSGEMRCLIVDDEELAREGIRKLLQAFSEVQVVGEAAHVESALKLMELRRPDVVFLDVQLRGETGFDLLERAEGDLPAIIFVTAHDRYATEAFQVEALHYLLKPVEPEQLDEALRRVKARMASGESKVGAVAHPAVLQTLGLTAREAEVLFWIAQGKSNPEIACILKNSPETVKKQVQSILTRLGVSSRVSAALIAAEKLGLQPGEA